MCLGLIYELVHLAEELYTVSSYQAVSLQLTSGRLRLLMGMHNIGAHGLGAAAGGTQNGAPRQARHPAAPLHILCRRGCHHRCTHLDYRPSIGSRCDAHGCITSLQLGGEYHHTSSRPSRMDGIMSSKQITGRVSIVNGAGSPGTSAGSSSSDQSRFGAEDVDGLACTPESRWPWPKKLSQLLSACSGSLGAPSMIQNPCLYSNSFSFSGYSSSLTAQDGYTKQSRLVLTPPGPITSSSMPLWLT